MSAGCDNLKSMLNFSQYVGLHKLLLICELPRVIDNQKVTLLSSYSGTVDTISSGASFYSLDNALKGFVL